MPNVRSQYFTLPTSPSIMHYQSKEDAQQQYVHVGISHKMKTISNQP